MEKFKKPAQAEAIGRTIDEAKTEIPANFRK